MVKRDIVANKVARARARLNILPPTGSLTKAGANPMTRARRSTCSPTAA